MRDEAIDIVLAWVDGQDFAWRAQRDRYRALETVDADANSEIRYQDWGNLVYWFRAVERFMPWVHRVFLVTWGHVPGFLRLDHPKLQIVRHEEFIPSKYLPVFNSSTIEMNFHRIKGLSERFILFNDDIFPLRPVEPSYYFHHGVPCDEAVESPIMPVDSGPISRYGCAIRVNAMLLINKHFNKRHVQEKNWWKWYFPGYGELLQRNHALHYWYSFVGFHDPHAANPYLKSTLQRIWEAEPEVLARGMNRFRSHKDLNQYLLRYWQICEGGFYPRRILGKSFLLRMNNLHEAVDGIRHQAWLMVSLNEDCTAEEFSVMRRRVNNALQSILPEKSSFEK